MKKINKKIRNGIIDRFFMDCEELPHMIEKHKNIDGWSTFLCTSSNHKIEIGYKPLFNQFILFSKLY